MQCQEERCTAQPTGLHPIHPLPAHNLLAALALAALLGATAGPLLDAAREAILRDGRRDGCMGDAWVFNGRSRVREAGSAGADVEQMRPV
jgi:hypothetical protein